MKSVLVTANDTEVGKTWVTATLARLLAETGGCVQIVKPVECGVPADATGDAQWAQDKAGLKNIEAFTCFSFAEPLAPLSTTGAEQLSLPVLIDTIDALPETDWRIIEGAGGVTVPIDPSGANWLDLAEALSVDAIVAVVENRLGTLNQTQLLMSYIKRRFDHCHLWLNTCKPQSEAVKQSNQTSLNALGIPIAVEQAFEEDTPTVHNAFWNETKSNKVRSRISFVQSDLEQRKAQGLERILIPRQIDCASNAYNLSNNDYLRLAEHPEVKQAAIAAIEHWGTSSSASPLITGYTALHRALEDTLTSWYGFQSGLVWNSGYSANQAILSLLPTKRDLVIADKWIHNSMVSGILNSGARLMRYQHCDVQHIKELLIQHAASYEKVYLVTESVFSMDGDYPKLDAMASLKEEFDFIWIVDEAHATGWYGKSGSGLIESFGVQKQVDIVVGTLGKALGSGGAYTLFQSSELRSYFINFAQEFIYSTYLPPANAAAALKAIELCQPWERARSDWQKASVQFRNKLKNMGWHVPAGDSPIVPIIVGEAEETRALSSELKRLNIQALPIRPPTVPPKTSRLRVSLNSSLSDEDYVHILKGFEQFKGQ